MSSFVTLELFADKDPDERVTLKQVANALPGRRPGKRLAYATVLRWAVHGRRGRKLRTFMAGGLRVTTWRHAEEFLSVEGDTEPTSRALPGRQSHQQAAAFLDRAGV